MVSRWCNITATESPGRSDVPCGETPVARGHPGRGPCGILCAVEARAFGQQITASAIAVLLLLAAACSGGGAPARTPEAAGSRAEAPASTSTTSEPAPVGGLVATVGTNRLFQPRRELGLALQNVGQELVVVAGVQLSSGLYEPLPVTWREVVLHPGGRRLVLPLPYGGVRCTGDGRADLTAVVLLDDGRELRVPAPEDHQGSVRRAHARECAAAEVRERVEIAFRGPWTRDGVAVSGTLSMSQRSAGPPVEIDDVVGNVIFTIRVGDGRSPVLRVSDREPDAEVPITISADRCDSHAVAEFKRPFVFLSWVRVGDEASTPVELEPTGSARAVLEELLASC